MAQFFNWTRRSRSIPLKLLLQGRILAIPLYAILRFSDLAREGMENSGSYRFADHIYRNQPSGRGWFGRWLDEKLLDMAAVRSFRNRFLASRNELCGFLSTRSINNQPLDVLSVPCGIPRELMEGARLFRARSGGSLERVTFHGLDLDADLLRLATEFTRQNGLNNFVAHHGDALERQNYPAAADFITCTGLAEFLEDEQLERLYSIHYEVLRPGGFLITSGMRRLWISEYLLRLAELRTHYRTAPQLEAILRRLPFHEVRTRVDEMGIQTILTASK